MKYRPISGTKLLSRLRKITRLLDNDALVVLRCQPHGCQILNAAPHYSSFWDEGEDEGLPLLEAKNPRIRFRKVTKGDYIL